MPDIRNEVYDLADTMRAKFTPPDFVPGCEVQSIADIDEYTTNNGWIEATVGPHNQQRVRYYGEPNGVQAGDFVDVEYFPAYRLYRVFGSTLGGTAVSGGARVDRVYESDFGAVALQADVDGDIGIGTSTPTSGERLSIQGDSGTDMSLGLYTGDGDGTDKASFFLYGVGTPSSIVNYERLVFEYDPIGVMRIQSQQAGSGTLRPFTIQTAGNSNQFYLTTDGKVGINTASLGSDTLAVKNASGGNTQFSFYTRDGDGSDFNSLILYGVGTPGSIANRERLIIQYNTGGSFRFQSEAQGTGTLQPLEFETEGNSNQLYLATDGNVGIGTTNPITSFHLSDTFVGMTFEDSDEALNEKIWQWIGNGGSLEIRTRTDANGAGSSAMSIDRSGTSISQVVFPNGDFGIGTTSPVSTFHLADTFVGMTFEDTDEASNEKIWQWIGNGGALDIRTRTDANGAGQTAMSVERSGTTVTEVNFPNGNVGIGTVSPSTRLDIDDGAMEFAEMTAPAAGAANTARLFTQDNGAGKTQLAVRFNTGAIQILATEP